MLVRMSLTIAAALVTPLALLRGVEAGEGGPRSATLRHRLAAESTVAVLPELLAADPRLQIQLERYNSAQVRFVLADLHVEVLIQDDTAKLPVALLGYARRPEALPNGLRTLQAAAGLPPLSLNYTRPSQISRGQEPTAALAWSGCLDDLFADPSDSALFGTPRAARAWTHYLTPLGRRVHAYRAAPAVLEAALQDLAPGLGTQLAHQRGSQSKPDLGELLEALELPEPVRREAAGRLTTRSQRFSLLIRTRLGPDVRQRYVVCDAADPPRVLINWEVAP